LGFGVYFEWGKPQNTEVSVHISESDEEEDLLEEDEAEGKFLNASLFRLNVRSMF
jgi:hypothetical protein